MKNGKIKKKLHNGFLWAMTYSAFMLFLFALASMDSDSWLPPITLVVSLVWLLLFSLANQDRW